jgi:outer membrane protein assembly factor BamB
MLATLLLTVTITAPLIAMMTTNYANNQPTTTPLNKPPIEAKRAPLPTVQQEWNYSTGTSYMDVSPAIADVDGDGKTEVLVGYGYVVSALSGSAGEWLRDYTIGGEGSLSFGESPAIADLYGNGTLCVLIVGNGWIGWYNGATGEMVLSAGYGSLYGSPAVGDINGTGKLDVVVGDLNAGVYCYNGTTGDKKWQYPAEASVYSSVTLADITGDGKLEVLVHTTNTTGYDSLQCVPGTATGGYVFNPLWSYNASQMYTTYSSPAVADIDNDTHMEVLWGSSDANLYCISHTGTLKWNYTTGAQIASSPTIVDIDGDGKSEILVGSEDSYVYCFNGTGALKWRYLTGNAVDASVAVADLDGDMKLEALVGSSNGSLYCLNRTGGLEWTYATGGPIYSSAAVADIDGDNQLEVVFESEDGYVYCLSVASAPFVPSAYPWPSIGDREDVRHTGCITDSDHDGLTDNYEIIAGTNPSRADTDADGATDYAEFIASTNPFLRPDEWSYKTGGNVISSPCVADVDGDGKLEVLVGSFDHNVYCLNGATGAKIWSYATGDWVESSPCVADVDGDGKLEVLVGSYDYNVYCLNGATGAKKWNYTTDGTVGSSPCVADVDGDGKLEVLVGSYGGVVCLNGDTGAKKWNCTMGAVFASPCVADVDSDAKLEVLASSWNDKSVYCLDGATGAKKWNYTTGLWVESSPCIADVDGDGKLEVLVGSWDRNVYCLNGTGAKEWNYTTGGMIYSSPCVADADADGRLEVLIGSRDHNVYCLNGASGAEKWSYTTKDIINSCPCVADLDGDCRLEVLVGSFDHNVYCLNGTTGAEERNYTTGDWVQSSPCVADVDGNGRLEVLVGSNDDSVYCLSVAGAPLNPSAYTWPSICLGGDIRHTGLYVDTDHDMLTDNYEITAGTDPLRPDTDTDGLTDYQEFLMSTNPLLDEAPPAQIIDLAASSPTGSTITLTWTAPGDNGNEGNATGYWVKYSKLGLVTASNWTSATNLTQSQLWMPAKNGTIETRIVSGLTPDTRYWFAIEAYDEVPNYSVISNCASGKISDLVPPAAMTDLAVTTVTNVSLTLTWTAPGDNGNNGNAAGYTVKYSTTGLITDANWESATTYTQSWIPVKNGTTETHVVTGLMPHTQYWFAIKAFDETPNFGDVSNSPSIWTLITGWQTNETVNLIPGPGNNATMPSGSFEEYGFTLTTNNATGVSVTFGTSRPSATGAPIPGLTSFLYLDISGTQTSGTTGAAVYLYYNRSLVQSLGIDEYTMQIYRWNATTSNWYAIQGSPTILNSTHGVIVAHLDHFSYFAVFGSPSGTAGNPASFLIILAAAGAAMVVVVAVVIVKKRAAYAKVKVKKKK